ncbi:hypothetical protein ACKWTF_005043 [Chironomus riparius]
MIMSSNKGDKIANYLLHFLGAMCDNARTGISSAALRYLQLIEQNEENGDSNLESLSLDVYDKLKGNDVEQAASLMPSYNDPFADNKKDDSLINSFKDSLARNENKKPEDSLMSSYSNPFVDRHENELECSYMKSFNNPFTKNIESIESNDNFFTDNIIQDPVNSQMKSLTCILDATDILIDDSDINYRPEIAQMSFLYSRDDQNSILVPKSSSKSIELESSSSKSFPSPPLKRFCFDSKESSLNKSNAYNSVTSESLFKETGKNINCTDDIFDMQNLNKSDYSISSVNDNSTTNSIFKQSLSSSIQSENSESNLDSTLKNVMCKGDDSSIQVNATELTRIKTCKVNTFYQAPRILNNKKIDEFYNIYDSTDWKSENIDLDNIMEPSIDYLLYKFKCLRPLTTGRKDYSISYNDEDGFDSDSINQGLDEIQDSFDNRNFICSTPEESENPDDKTNLLKTVDLNMAVNAVTSKNVCQEDDDNNTTKSFLVNKKSKNVWSAITHVSCSIPLIEQESSEPQFDITTIFDFSNQNEFPNEQESLNNDTARFELMLSVLKDCNNSVDKTTSEVQETLKIAKNRKAAIFAQIEMLTQALVTSLVNQNAMIIKLHRIKDWKDCKYESNVLSQKETAIKIKSLSFTNKNTERTFTIFVHLLGEIYKLLGQNITCTKRELYYRDVELTKSQVSVNKAIDEICSLLNVQCWELGVLSTSKGLVAGDLRIITDEDELIDYSTTNSVPQKPSGIKSMESNAEYVLVVEKDTVFTRLIEENIMEKIGKKIILITAKGYPDINTRVMLKRIEMELQKPIYIIVDADAYGIDIMCTYKFGSLQMVKFSEQLAVPTMEWIGIYPTSIEKLDITRTQLTDADVKKVDELLARPYINDHLKTELAHLKNRGLKAEIESIYHFSIDYLIHDYIPQTIAAIPGPNREIIRGSSCFKEHLFS